MFHRNSKPIVENKYCFLFTKVLSLFEEFQLSKGVNPTKNGFNEYPKCYSTIRMELSESVFLKDLKIRNFEMVKRKQPITYDQMSLCMRALGKFHAISLALKDQESEKFKQLTGLLFEQSLIVYQTDFKKHFVAMFERFMFILEKENRSDLVERVRIASGEDVIETALELVAGASAEPFSVICHGDLTVNNTMFRCDAQGKPVEIQLFDWQFSRYASPVTDLIVYLLCCSTKELRDQHYDDFLKIYHDSLTDLLGRYTVFAENYFFTSK